MQEHTESKKVKKKKVVCVKCGSESLTHYSDSNVTKGAHSLCNDCGHIQAK